MGLTHNWPELKLTEDELRYNAPYANFNGLNDARPGVLRRVYPVTLIYSSVPGETSVSSTQFIPSGRRTRLFALTFSGDVEFWFVSMKSQSGEIYFPDTMPVTLLGLPNSGGSKFQTRYGNQTTSLYRPNAGPFWFEPNIVLQGAQAIVFAGAPTDTTLWSGATERTVLHIACHVWEFPNWGPSGTVPQAAGQQGAPAAGAAGIGGMGLQGESPVGPAAIARAGKQIAQQLVSRLPVVPQRGTPAFTRSPTQTTKPPRRK